MTPDKQKALRLIASGFAFSLVAFVANAALAPGPRVAQMMSLGIVFGMTIFVLGCAQLARAKGRPWYFGALGLLSLLGLAILWYAVPDAPTSRSN